MACLGWNTPVARNPDIFPAVPPPIAISPGMAGIRLFAAVIIHWLAGRIFV
jgi:hypothetical protein